MTIYLTAVSATAKDKDKEDVRANLTRSLLCFADETGIFLYDRRVRMNHLWPWEKVLELHQQTLKEKGIS